MKLKYYLRGLGMGMLVTALVMGAAPGRGKETLSDAEIKARAIQLGMTDNSSRVLSDLQGNSEESMSTQEGHNTSQPPDTENPETTEPLDTQSQDITKSSDTQESQQSTPSSEAEGTGADMAFASQDANSSSGDHDNKEPSVSDTQESPDYTRPSDSNSGQDSTEFSGSLENQEKITISVKSGDSSVSVSRILAEAGLVADAEAYDRYLCANGYDKSICVGTYQITVGTSEEDIAKIITKKKKEV